MDVKELWNEQAIAHGKASERSCAMGGKQMTPTEKKLFKKFVKEAAEEVAYKEAQIQELNPGKRGMSRHVLGPFLSTLEKLDPKLVDVWEEAYRLEITERGAI